MSVVLSTGSGDIAGVRTSLLVLPCPEGGIPAALESIDRDSGGALSRCISTGDFSGRRDETVLAYGSGAATRILLIGIGARDKVSDAIVRRAAMIAGRRARTIGAADAAVFWYADAAPAISARRAGQLLAEGVPFGAWHFPDLKRAPEHPKPSFERCELRTAEHDTEFAAGVQLGTAIANGQELTRGLQVLPGNTCTPEFVAKRAEEIAARHDFAITVLDRAGVTTQGMKALIAVSQGSALEPRFVVLEHKGSDAPPVVLIGKGVTFDTGGISLKPADKMEDMKYDMSGAAAVLGTFETIGQLGLKQHVIGIVPLCENMPSGSAYKPGDVVGSHLGKTIEVVNTDAEGRLILADALSWARRYSPASVINCATLTGAIVIGLGHTAAGLMGTDEPLMDAVRAAGERADERVWPLPLWDEYRELIKSDIADMKNSGGRPGGSITAGWFLREFAEGYPWAHVDIAGTAYTDRDSATQVRGPTGTMVRLYAEYLLART